MFILADHCAGVNCNYGTCYEGRCTCSEGYTGPYCDTLSEYLICLKSIESTMHCHCFILVAVIPPALLTAPTTPRTAVTVQNVPMIGPKKGQLIDYGRVLGARAGPIGWILGVVSALLLVPLALAFAARKCTQGACLPGGARSGYVPVLTGNSGVTQTENGNCFFLYIETEIDCIYFFFFFLALYAGPGSRATRDLQLIDQRGDNLAASAAAASSGGLETTRIEQTRGK